MLNHSDLIPQTSTEKSLTSPASEVKSSSNKLDTIAWQASYISSQNVLHTGDNFENLFGYQILVTGHTVQDTDHAVAVHESYYGLCIVKIYPKSVKVEGCEYLFTHNPVKASSSVMICPKNKLHTSVEILWKGGTLTHKVLSKEEFVPTEILQKCICQLQDFVEETYLPEIQKKITECL